MEEKAFVYEIQFWQRNADLIRFINDWLDDHEWKMSPSRWYAFLADLVRWHQACGIEPTKEPAFDFIVERLIARSNELWGTELDFALAMEMNGWRDREAPIPGHPSKSIGQIFDWFMPTIRTLDSLAAAARTRRSRGGESVTNAEALDWVFMAVDRCCKDKHFQTRTDYGLPIAFPWVDFVRDELFEFKKKFKLVEPVVKPPATSVAFSVG